MMSDNGFIEGDTVHHLLKWAEMLDIPSGDSVNQDLRAAAAEITALRAEVERLREALRLARRAIGDHHAPNDCYATGPLTGDDYRDLVECPACAFLAALEEKA